MSWLWVRPRIRRSFRLALFRRDRSRAELDEELRLHLELRTAQLVARGLEPDQARVEALRRMGSSTIEEALSRLLPSRTRLERRMRIRDWLGAIRQDAGFTLRQLRRSPGFTFAVVGTLAIAIGATATMFGIVDRLMLRPPAHVVAPESIYRVFMTVLREEGEDRSIARSPYAFFELARERATGARVAGSHLAEVAVGRGREASRANVTFVTPGYFALLGTRPHSGRFITDEEAHHETGARVAVLGHGAWLRRFGGESSAIGRTIDIEGLAHTIVGVAPKGFHGTRMEPVELWAPMATLHAMPSTKNLFYFHNAVVEVLARPAAGNGVAQTGTELSVLLLSSDENRPLPRGRARLELRADLVSLSGAIGPDMKRPQEATVAIWLAGVSILLLLVACANVASLFLLRAEQRARELAVRLSLGVGRGRLAMQLFIECATVVVLGGLAALVVTATGGAWLRRVLLPDVAWEGWAADQRMLLLTIAALVITAIITGLAPAVHAFRATPQGLLAGSARQGAGATRRGWLQRPLLLAQTALTVVLLVGAGLFVRSLHELRSVDLGIQPERVIVVTAEFSNIGWRSAEINAFAQRAIDRLRGVPGVEAVALAESAPLVGSIGAGSVRIPGRDSLVAALGSSPLKSTVSPGFFDVVGMQLVRGRVIDERDTKAAPLVTVINETMAQRLWPDGSAIGDCFYVGNVPQCFTVVGIVRDAHRFRYVEEPRPFYFLALAQETFAKHPSAILVRTDGDAERYIGRVKEALDGVAPELPLLEVASLQSRLDPQARPWQLGATVFTIYGAFAGVLAALGLYSAIAFGVVMRKRELGVRIAIGARGRQILGLILGEGVRIGVVGLAIGLGITVLAADRLGERLTELLFRVAPTDVGVMLGVVALLLSAIVLASLVPAWRATRVDPMIAMRAE